MVHELGKLGAAKELPYRGHHRAYVHQPLRGSRFRVDKRHLFLDHPLHAQEADSHLVLDQFTYRPDPTVAQMVDVVRAAIALVDTDHRAYYCHHVIDGQSHQARVFRLVKPLVQLVPAHPTQIVTAGREEKVSYQVAGVFQTGRLTRPQPPVELYLSVGDAFRQGRVELHLLDPFFLRVQPVPETSKVVILKVHVFGLGHGITVQSGANVLVDLVGIDIGEQVQDFLVRRYTQGAKEGSGRDLALTINLDREDILGAGLELQPSTPGRDQLGKTKVPVARSIPFIDEINAW